MRARALTIVAVSAVLLAGCSAPTPQPSPTLSASPTVTAEPTTLAELGRAVTEEGLVDTASLGESGGSTGSLQINLSWKRPPGPEAQLAALAEVQARIDAIPGQRPETTAIALLTLDSHPAAGIVTSFDPGPDVLLAMLDAVRDSPCPSASLERRDRGSGERTEAELRCYVDAADIVGLASAYDEITAYRVEVDGVDTRWQVSLADRSTSDGLLRLDVGPVEGRQQLLVDVATLAAEGGADRITVIDTGDSFSVSGFADGSQQRLCTTINDAIVAAGIEVSGVRMQLREATSDPKWACYLTP